MYRSYKIREIVEVEAENEDEAIELVENEDGIVAIIHEDDPENYEIDYKSVTIMEK